MLQEYMRMRELNHILQKSIKKRLTMQNYCDLDVHKDSVFMCVLNESGVIKNESLAL